MTQTSEDPFPELMVLYQQGDESAFEEIYRRTVDSVSCYLRRWSEGAARADLVQETYLQVHRARRTYRPEYPFRPWLLAIARHVALGAVRTRSRRWSREVGVEELPERMASAAEPDVLERRRLEEALSRLPADQREVVWLAQVEGMNSAEISRVTGATAGAIRVRLHRANRKLRELLGATSHVRAVEEEEVD